MARAISFDTLKYTKRLEDAAIPRDQAEAQAAALSEVFDSDLQDLATKGNLQELETRIKADMAEIKGEIRLNRWMLVLIIAVTVLPALRTLFGL